MQATKLPQQLAQELRRNPKKAIVLALLLALAAYFWGPLVWRAIHKQPDSPALASLPTDAVVAAPASATSAKAVVRLTWQEIVRLTQQHRQPRENFTNVMSQRNPFAKPAEPSAAGADGESPKTTVPTSPTEAEMKDLPKAFKLSGISLGAQRRVAVINGRPYAEGAVVVNSENRLGRVEKIEARSVTLEMEGRRLQLHLPQPSAKPNLEIVPLAPHAP